jgi:hypothetical protein
MNTDKPQTLRERTEWEIELLRAAYEELEPVSGLERDFMMRIKRQADLYEELLQEITDLTYPGGSSDA